MVDSEGHYIGSVTYYDLTRGHPSLGKDGNLLVGAAVSPFDLERAKKLSKHADFLVIDVAHADNENVISAVARMVKEVDVGVVFGNVGTYKGAVDAITRIDYLAGAQGWHSQRLHMQHRRRDWRRGAHALGHGPSSGCSAGQRRKHSNNS